MDLVLITNILEESVTEVALVKPQAWFLPSSFHPRLPVTFTTDEFIIGFKRVHHASDKHTFSANTPKKPHKIGFLMFNYWQYSDNK